MKTSLKAEAEVCLHTLEAILARKDDDPERDHREADEALCAFITSLGHRKIVNTYNEINKWFA